MRYLVSARKNFLSVTLLTCSALLSVGCNQTGSSPAGNGGTDAAAGNQTPGSIPGTGDQGSNPIPSGPDTAPTGSGLPGGTGLPGSTGATDDPNKPNDPSDPGKGNEPEPEPEPAECQENAIRSCSQTPDGREIVFPTGVPLGNCKKGEQKCSDGSWSACEGAIAPAGDDNCQIPGDDSDCNGVSNEGCDCIEGETRPCGESDEGVCKMGTQTCVEGKWGSDCPGAIFPSEEKCDGKGEDEDCDGKSDLDDTDCECIDGTTEYCQRAGQKGDCKWGQKTCSEGSWSTCEEWAKPLPEECGSREAVEGVKWTGDEDCDGGVDTSPFGKRPPNGCVKMMLDQDGDGYGRMGKDLSELKDSSQLSLLATACLCPKRPDIAQKKAEGWREVNGKQYSDCGDCKPGLDGEKVHPRTTDTAVKPNRCLQQVRWQLSTTPPTLGDFDLNCDGRHTDPGDVENIASPIKCEADFNTGTCSVKGPGRLIPREPRGLWCGGTFAIGKCVPVFKNGGSGQDDPNGKVLQRCEPKPDGTKQYTIRCQ